ncbi:GntR family transcriptional regulator [Microbacterium sp. CGR1]|uniref:GntR family transcriptional regulator n=1 Tax=Microbacterium sp. CGR1 TaxID=1696072 RepID=UPI003DA40E25
MTIAYAEPQARQWIHHGSVPLPELAFQHILVAILQGEYVSGDTLNTTRFARELDMSLNPIREAIIRLRDIGLVEVTPARYTKVADFTTPESRAAIGYAGVLAGAALRRAVSMAAGEVREDLAAHLALIGRADAAADRNAAAIAFLTAVADLVEHPRQARHLVESTILAQCALQFAENAPRDATTQGHSTVAGAAARAIRDGEPETIETTVRALFEQLA